MGTLIFKKDYNLNLDVLNKCIQGGIINSRLGLMLKSLAKSINADGLNIDELDRHDLFFIPKNESEKILWENLRQSAKIQIKSIDKNRINGQKGGRPKKIEQIVNVQKLEPKPTPVATEENKAKVHNMLEMVAGSYKATDAVVGIFDKPDGTTKEGIRIKNPRLMAFVRQRFDKKVLDKASDWAIDHNQRGHTYNASSLLKLFCRFQSDVEPTINFNHVQSEYLTFKFKG